MYKIMKKERRFPAFVISCFIPVLITVCMNVSYGYMLTLAETAGANVLFGLACSGVVFIIIPAVLTKLQSLVQLPFAKKFITVVKKRVFDRIISLDFEEFVKEDRNKYLSLLINDLKVFEEQYLSSFKAIIESLGTMVAGFVFLILVSYRIAMIALVFLLLTFALSVFVKKKLSLKKTEVSKKSADYICALENMLNGHEAVYLSGTVSAFVDKVNTKSEKQEKLRKDYFVLDGFNSVVLSKVSSVLLLGALALFAIMIGEGKLLLSQATIAVLAINMLTQNISKFLPSYMSMVSTEHLLKEWMSEDENKSGKKIKIESLNETKVFTDEDIVMQISNLSFAYQGRKVLKGFSEKIRKRDKVLIRGTSGCGKSTLMSLLCGLREGYEGSILYKGKEVSLLEKITLFHDIAVIFQDVFIFDDTIRNNITLFKEVSQEEVDKAIDKAGLRDVIEGLKDKCETRLSQNGMELSGGQRQRISIARAIVSKANVIFADEPTSNLPDDLANEIESDLLNLDATVILISHREKTAVNDKLTKIIDLS